MTAIAIDLIVRGDQVVTPDGTIDCDLAISGGEVVGIGPRDSYDSSASRVLDASGKVVVPGGIEPHAHQCMHIAQHPELDYYSLGPEEDTVGMVHGGVTTHLDFCFVNPADDVHATLEDRLQRWKGQSHTDYSFHIGFLGDHPKQTFELVPELIQGGFPSFKAFTVNTRKDFRLDYGRMAMLMDHLSEHGGLLAVHAEDEDIVQFNYERAYQEDKVEGWRINEVRSHLAEEMAFRYVIALARAKEAATYFVHASTRDAVAALAEARGAGLPVYGETLHHYACRTAEVYRAPRGYCHHTYPSLKTEADRQALWQGLISGELSSTATDEMPTSLEVKLRGDRIDNLTGGNLGAEARMGIVYTEGVVHRGMTLERFVDITSTNAAKIFGLYPRKGAIAVGSDADLAIIDPSIRRPLTIDDFHVADYSPWEGWEVQGWPVATVLRGRPIVENGELVEPAPLGELVTRHIDRGVLETPAC